MLVDARAAALVSRAGLGAAETLVR